MTTYGVTPKGFVKPRLPELRAEIINDIQARLSALAGRAVTIETAPNSINGVYIDSNAERYAALWERAEALYLAMYPRSAEGVNLDNAASFTGVERQDALQGIVYGLISGAVGTPVPATFQVKDTVSQRVFQLRQPVTITTTNVAAFRLEVTSIVANQNYTLTINGQQKVYSAPSNVSLAAILAEMLTFIQQQGLAATIVNSGINAQTDGKSYVSVVVGNAMRLATIEVPAVFRAVEFGTFDVPAGALTDIVTPVNGVTGVRNLIDGIPGRLREQDDEFRVEYALGPHRLGASGLDAIRANIRANVPGVIECVMYENDTNETDAAGRPAGSIEAIIRGGDTQELLNELFRVKGGGIKTYGLNPGNAVDSEGQSHAVAITRPQNLYVWVSARIVLKAGKSVGSETYSNFKNIIIDEGNKLKTGDDVIQQEFIGPLYDSSDAIASVELSLFASTSPTYVPNLNEYRAANVTVGDRQLPVFSAGRVTVY